MIGIASYYYYKGAARIRHKVDGELRTLASLMRRCRCTEALLYTVVPLKVNRSSPVDTDDSCFAVNPCAPSQGYQLIKPPKGLQSWFSYSWKPMLQIGTTAKDFRFTPFSAGVVDAELF